MESIARNQATVERIQLLEDAQLNPLTGLAWPPTHAEILATRRQLPVYREYKEILEVYHRSQVIILSGETGSGKSTQVPQLLVYDEAASGLQIACTQPRRLAAKEVAARVAQEMGVVLGEEVGYQIRGDSMVDQNEKKTRLAYVTEGVLLRRLHSDRNLASYASVIIDEAHERTIDVDMLLMLLKHVVSRRPDFKVVIMSATMNAGTFQRYFGNCPLVQIPGRQFDVALRYLAPGSAVGDIVASAAHCAMAIHRTKDAGHILIFLPGVREINEVCGILRGHTEGLDIFPLYSALSSQMQRSALSSSSHNRKCIVATNIAETSLTIDGIVDVIDSGVSNQMMYNPPLRLNMLDRRSISQASAKQRAGRVGRTRNGICFRLYTEEMHNHLEPSTEPGILCGSLDSAILRLAAAGHHDILNLDWIDAPCPDSFMRASQDLRDWGFLKDDGTTTQIGRTAAGVPLDPIWFHAIEVAAGYGCSLDMLDIAVLCSSNTPIIKHHPAHRQAKDRNTVGIVDQFSDHITLLNAYNTYMEARRVQMEDETKFSLEKWCSERGLDHGALEEVRLRRQNLGSHLLAAGVRAGIASITDTISIRRALAVAFCTQTAYLGHRQDDRYQTVHGNVCGLLSPFSTVAGRKCGWIVYTTFRRSGAKCYLEGVTAINPEWLVDLPYFQDDRFSKSGTGSLRQPDVKRSIDRAKAGAGQL